MPDGWIEGMMDNSSGNVFAGNYSLYSDGNSSVQSGNNTAVQGGQTYTLTITAKTNGTVQLTARVNLGGGNFACNGGQLVFSGSTWSSQSCVFTLPASINQFKVEAFESSGFGNGEFWLGQVQLLQQENNYVVPGGECVENFTVSIPAGYDTLGNKPVSWEATWTQNNEVVNQYFEPALTWIDVTGNPQLVAGSTSVNLTAQHGQTAVDYNNVTDPGNIQVTGVTLSKLQETMPVGWITTSFCSYYEGCTVNGPVTISGEAPATRRPPTPTSLSTSPRPWAPRQATTPPW